MNELETIRNSFPVFKEYIYFNTNAGAPIGNVFLKSAIEKLNDYANRGGLAVNEWKGQIEQSREKVASILNCHEDEVAFINSVSLGMNLLSGMFPKHYGIISFSDDFPTSFVNWIHNGYQVEIVGSQNGEISIKDIEDKIKQNKQIKILIASHVMYKTGFCFDLNELGALAKKYNLIFIADVTQSFGVKSIDVREMNIDILLFHGYKWITAGYGVGAMYVSRKILDSYEPKQIGWNSVEYEQDNFYQVSDYTKFKLKRTSKVFEGGNKNALNISILNEVLDSFVNNKISIYESHISSLVAYFQAECKKNGIVVLTNFKGKNLSGIQRIKIGEKQYENVKHNKIIARFIGGVLTIAISFYNCKEDIDRLIEVILEESTAKNN